jgi:hypothetical protein
MNTADTLLAHFLPVQVIRTLAESFCCVLPCRSAPNRSVGEVHAGYGRRPDKALLICLLSLRAFVPEAFR